MLLLTEGTWLQYLIAVIIVILFVTARAQYLSLQPDNAQTVSSAENWPIFMTGSILLTLAVVGFFAAPDVPISEDRLGLAVAPALFAIFAATGFFARLAFSLAQLTLAPNVVDIAVFRWIGRIGLSALVTICAYALVFRILGIVPPADTVVQLTDYFYLSTVTFSTLGYGDFQPDAHARLAAGWLSILGNLHLGLFVGLCLVVVSSR